MIILQYRESLVRSLLLGTPFEKLKPGPRQQSAIHSKRNVGRRCTGYYAKERELKSREANYAAVKKIKTFCCDCDNFFVLIVLTRSIMLWNKGLKESTEGRTDDTLCLTSCLRKKPKKVFSI